MTTLQLKQSIGRSPLRLGFLLIPLALGCFALSPTARAGTPASDECPPNFSTAKGCDALYDLTTGLGNTALGWRALFENFKPVTFHYKTNKTNRPEFGLIAEEDRPRSICPILAKPPVWRRDFWLADRSGTLFLAVELALAILFASLLRLVAGAPVRLSGVPACSGIQIERVPVNSAEDQSREQRRRLRA